MAANRVLFWVPLPPPMAGPEMASRWLVDECTRLIPGLMVENASLRASNMQKGQLDWQGIAAFARAYLRFIRAARHADVIYLVAAANVVGSVRDALLVATARVLGKRVVLHFRGGRYGDFYENGGPLLRPVLRASWGSAARAIVQAPRLRDQLSRAAPHVELVVLPNGLPAARFPAKVRYETAAPRLLFVGHLTYSKGFFDLIRAFRRLREKWPALVLSCAGELPDPNSAFDEFLPPERRREYRRSRRQLCSEIREFVASGQAVGVDYAGLVTGDAKAALFTSADIFVLPSYTEGVSLAMLEAMFFGLPVVTTDCGGSPDVIEDRRHGRLVPIGDVDALTSALDELIADSALREAMGKRNAEEARERYDLGVVARQLAAIVTLSSFEPMSVRTAGSNVAGLGTKPVLECE